MITQKENLPEDFKVYCEDCDSYITKYSSCECGRTSQDLIDIEINNNDLDQRYN